MTPSRPYYLREPWSILFQESKLERTSPWEVNLTELLSSLLKEMEAQGIDFHLAGTAVYSSVLIFARKAELLLKSEELRRPREERKPYLPPPIQLPFRFEHTTTTVDDLIEALEKALTERRAGSKKKPPTLPLPIPDFLEAEDYLLEIQDRSRQLLEELKGLAALGRRILFSRITVAMDLLETVRVFMMLLFLAQAGDIDLVQEEDGGEIEILVLGG